MGLQAFVEPFMSIIVKGAPAVAMGECPLDGFEGTAQLNGIPHHGFLGFLLDGVEHIHEAIEGQHGSIESVEFSHDVMYPHISGKGPHEIAGLPLLG